MAPSPDYRSGFGDIGRKGLSERLRVAGVQIDEQLGVVEGEPHRFCPGLTGEVVDPADVLVTGPWC